MSAARRGTGALRINYTLNRKCMMSPSWTVYSLPSVESFPAALTAASDL